MFKPSKNIKQLLPSIKPCQLASLNKYNYLATTFSNKYFLKATCFANIKYLALKYHNLNLPFMNHLSFAHRNNMWLTLPFYPTIFSSLLLNPQKLNSIE